MLSRFGNVTAMERDDYAREHIPSDVEAEILKGWLPDGLSSINNKKFDLICLFDVLEHIKEDVQSLVILKDYLKPGAKLLLTAPAYPWMFSTHDANLGHYRRYTRRELLLKCKNTGYKIRYAGYMNMFLLPFMILIRFIDKIIYCS
jgi:2-polyprenyl-3-methyl-5-hydroxy-6-metoxy-1,4-benzoquinol methylase